MAGKRGRKDKVEHSERRKAEFLRELAAVCHKYGMVPTELEIEGEEYKPYVVLDCSDDTSIIDSVIQELNYVDLHHRAEFS